MNAGLILVTGGVRAGKSAFAEQLAAARGEDVLYVATAEPGDDEMRRRIEAHRRGRPQTWRTIETPHDLAGPLRAEARPDAALVDCLTIWTSNVLLHGLDPDSLTAEQAQRAEDGLFARLGELLDWQRETAVPLIAVTNEVGLGVVPATAAGRLYRDALGRVNQRVAEAAEEVYLVIAGLALPLRGLGATPVHRMPDAIAQQRPQGAVR